MTHYATPFDTLHAVSLLSHRSRLSKFEKAITASVGAESRVVDLGTGSGVLALMAAQAGAGKVTAVDINRESLDYAKRAAILNGLDRNVEFVNCHFRDYVPDEKADIVMCEMLSSFLLIEQQIPAAAHANAAILKEGGSLIPESAVVYGVPVECEAVWNRFRTNGLCFPPVVQTVERGQARDLSDLAVIASFNLLAVDEDTSVDCTVSFEAVEEGTVHGLLGMFEATLVPGIQLQMADGWKELLIPLEKPLYLSEGDVVSLRIAYKPGVYDSLVFEVEP